MIGIGLGGFMDGLQGGMRTRQAMDDRKRQKVIDERQDTEYNRSVKQRDDIAAINTQAQSEFNNRVSAGTAKPDQFDQFWNDYALPKLKNTYLAQGNIEMADKVQKWGESEDTRAGAKLAMSALTKAQTGDVAGALADATEAGKRRGYLSHGYEIMGQDTIVDPQGQLQGYRLQMKGPDGKEITQDLPLAQVPKLIATYLNPEAAWQSQIAGQQEEGKRQTELKTYEDKKKIDKQYGTGENKSRGDAISALRKRMDGGLAGDEQKFDDLPRDQQEKMISQEIELQSGQPGLGAPAGAASPADTSGRKVLVDTATGQPVPPARSQASPSSAPASKPQQAGGEPERRGWLGGLVDTAKAGLAREADTLRGRNVPQSQAGQERVPRKETREDRVSYLLGAAEAAIKDGAVPERIADELAQNGVPEEDWPEVLRRALAQRQRASIGIAPR